MPARTDPEDNHGTDTRAHQPSAMKHEQFTGYTPGFPPIKYVKIIPALETSFGNSCYRISLITRRGHRLCRLVSHRTRGLGTNNKRDAYTVGRDNETVEAQREKSRKKPSEDEGKTCCPLRNIESTQTR